MYKPNEFWANCPALQCRWALWIAGTAALLMPLATTATTRLKNEA